MAQEIFSDFESIEEWLYHIKNEDTVNPRWEIPNYTWLVEYIDNIEEKSVEEVLDLIRTLLGPINRNGDMEQFQSEEFRANLDNEIFKDFKLNKHSELYYRMKQGHDAWEGLTWILDLLPHHPYKAIKAIESYVLAQTGLPEQRITGAQQCIDLISAKFIFENTNEEFIRKLFHRDFELLVAQLYLSMGFDIFVTPATRDGGKDIIATSQFLDGDITTYIECKLYNSSRLTTDNVRAFAYIVSQEQANQGVLFCTGHVSEELKKIDKRVRIITMDEIVVLLNAYLGSEWRDRLPLILDNQRRKLTNNNI